MNRGNLTLELYNLAKDVGEQENVAVEHPEVVARLQRLMEQEHEKSDLYPLRPLDAPPLNGPRRS